MKCNLAHIFFL